MKKLIIYEGVVNVINKYLSPEETKEFISLLTDWVFNDVEPFGKSNSPIVDSMLVYMGWQIECEKDGLDWEECLNREVKIWTKLGLINN